MSYRRYAYCKDYPDGFLFTDEDEYNQAMANGWVEAAYLVKEDEIATGWKEHPELTKDIRPGVSNENLPKKRGNPNWHRRERQEIS